MICWGFVFSSLDRFIFDFTSIYHYFISKPFAIRMYWDRLLHPFWIPEREKIVRTHFARNAEWNFQTVCFRFQTRIVSTRYSPDEESCENSWSEKCANIQCYASPNLLSVLMAFYHKQLYRMQFETLIQFQSRTILMAYECAVVNATNCILTIHMCDAHLPSNLNKSVHCAALNLSFLIWNILSAIWPRADDWYWQF